MIRTFPATILKIVYSVSDDEPMSLTADLDLGFHMWKTLQFELIGKVPHDLKRRDEVLIEVHQEPVPSENRYLKQYKYKARIVGVPHGKIS